MAELLGHVEILDMDYPGLPRRVLTVNAVSAVSIIYADCANKVHQLEVRTMWVCSGLADRYLSSIFEAGIAGAVDPRASDYS